jgi:hypothetical protein
MSILNVEQLDTSSESQREEYERAFYAAFERAAGNLLIRKLWLFDGSNRRLCTRIPYEEQIVYVLRSPSGQIVTGMGVNSGMRSFQASAYGFQPPPDPSGCCEFLTLFSVGEYRLATRFEFQADSFRRLSKKGFHTAYATTARRVLRGYLRVGAQVLEEKEIEGEMRYFLKFNLESFAHSDNKGDI